ncbi:MAG: hypothetical protein AAGK02_00360 [Pseudomonadota bacterium]
MKRIFASVVGFLGLAGCSLQSNVQVSALDYNRAIANSNNSQILLNIVRASEQEPLYFSRIGSITGSFEATAGIQAAIPVGPNVTRITPPNVAVNTVTPSATISTKPTFDIQPLDDEKFWERVLRPTSLNVFNYFWQQGWPKQLLIHLFVEDVTIKLPNGPVCSLSSFPPARSSFSNFDAFAAALAELRPILKPRPASNIGLPISVTSVESLQHMQKLLDAGVSFTVVEGGKIQLQKSAQSDLIFGDSSSGGKEFDGPVGRCKQTVVDELRAFAKDAAMADVPKPVPGVSAKVTLRSPHGIIVYVGEILRAQLGNPELGSLEYVGYTRGGLEDRNVIFNAQTGLAGEGISVDYEGTVFSVDPEDSSSDKSTLTIALIQQVLSISTSVEGFTPTETVRFLD